MRILFGFSDVLTLDAWLDHFESLGHSVDGAMTGEDLLGVANSFKPGLLVSEYALKGEIDGLGVFYELSARPKLSALKMVLIAEFGDPKNLNSRFIMSGGIIAVVKPGQLSFEAVEELL